MNISPPYQPESGCCSEFVQSDPEGLRRQESIDFASRFNFAQRPPSFMAGPFLPPPPLLPAAQWWIQNLQNKGSAIIQPSFFPTQPNTPVAHLPLGRSQSYMVTQPTSPFRSYIHSPAYLPSPFRTIKIEEKAGTVNWRVVENKPLMAMKINFADGEFKIRNESLFVQAEAPTSPGETGLRIWDAGVVLAKYIEKEGLSDLLLDSTKEAVKRRGHSHVRVLELGCGTGLVGIAAALLGGEVVCSDKEILRERTEANISWNTPVVEQNGGVCEFMSFDWNKPQQSDISFGNHDLILASDVLWSDVFVEPFTKALKMASAPHSTILLAQKARSEDLESLIHAKLSEEFEVEERIESSSTLTADFQHDKIYILKLRLR